MSQVERGKLRRAMAEAVWRAGYETGDSGAVLRQKDHTTAQHDRLCEAARHAEVINNNYYNDHRNPARVTVWPAPLDLPNKDGSETQIWLRGYAKDGSAVYTSDGTTRRRLSQVRPATGHYRVDTDFVNLWEYFSSE